jgi:hypothetical protein
VSAPAVPPLELVYQLETDKERVTPSSRNEAMKIVCERLQTISGAGGEVSVIPSFVGIGLLAPNAVTITGAILLTVVLEVQTRVIEEPYLSRVNGDFTPTLPPGLAASTLQSVACTLVHNWRYFYEESAPHTSTVRHGTSRLPSFEQCGVAQYQASAFACRAGGGGLDCSVAWRRVADGALRRCIYLLGRQ